MNLCILIPLLVGLLSALLGYLLGRLFSKNNTDNDTTNTNDIDFWRSKNAQLEQDLAACRESLNDGDGISASSGISSNTSIPSSVASFTAGAVTKSATTAFSGVSFDADAAKAAFGKKIKENDLTVVEGIGPKISELFQENGINTWGELAATAVSKLQEYLDSKGERYRVHNPGTWPMQAGLAHEGKWEELKKWQDEHDYGKTKK